MEGIKQATPEQVARIAADSDLTNGSLVVAFGDDTAVIRMAVELDPLHCESPKRKAWFIWGLENWMRLNGVQEYYFNVAADDAEWQQAVEGWGAERTSLTPEFRYKKRL